MQDYFIQSIIGGLIGVMVAKFFLFLQTWNENRKFRKRLSQLMKAIESRAKRDRKLDIMMSGMVIISFMAMKGIINKEMLEKKITNKINHDLES